MKNKPQAESYNENDSPSVTNSELIMIHYKQIGFGLSAHYQEHEKKWETIFNPHTKGYREFLDELNAFKKSELLSKTLKGLSFINYLPGEPSDQNYDKYEQLGQPKLADYIDDIEGLGFSLPNSVQIEFPQDEDENSIITNDLKALIKVSYQPSFGDQSSQMKEYIRSELLEMPFIDLEIDHWAFDYVSSNGDFTFTVHSIIPDNITLIEPFRIFSAHESSLTG